MADVLVSTTSVELRVTKLTKSIYKQLPLVNNWDDLRKLIAGADDLRSPFETQRLKAIEAKYSTAEGASEEERSEAEAYAKKQSFADWMKHHCIGWLHGSIRGDEFARDLLVNVSPGQYVIYANAHMSTINLFKQVFVL